MISTAQYFERKETLIFIGWTRLGKGAGGAKKKVGPASTSNSKSSTNENDDSTPTLKPEGTQYEM